MVPIVLRPGIFVLNSLLRLAHRLIELAEGLPQPLVMVATTASVLQPRPKLLLPAHPRQRIRCRRWRKKPAVVLQV